MRFVKIGLIAGGLMAVIFGTDAGLAPARADIISLSGVQFSDGGTAGGFFSENILGFLAVPQDIETSAGSTVTAGQSYDTPGLGSANSPTDTVFTFATDVPENGFLLVLEFSSALTVSTIGVDALVPGGGTGASPTGSYEECVSSASFCDGLAFDTIRFITAGGAQVPEPASLTILGFAAAAAFATRRIPRLAA